MESLTDNILSQKSNRPKRLHFKFILIGHIFSCVSYKLTFFNIQSNVIFPSFLRHKLKLLSGVTFFKVYGKNVI